MYRRLITIFFIFTFAAALYAGSLDTRISKMQFFGPDNSLFLEIFLAYDDNGNIIKSRLFDQSLRLLGTEEYFFDDKGGRIREITYDSGRQLEKYTLIEFKDGKRIRKSYNSDDILIMIMEDEYDKNGAITTVTEYSVSNGQKQEIQSVSKYSRIGKNDLKCSRDARGADMNYYYIIKFSHSGRIEEVSYYTSKGVKSGYVKIIHEEGTMTQQSLDLVIY